MIEIKRPDLRRKLNDNDYDKIYFEYWSNHTIRDIASTHNVSTKYIKNLVRQKESIHDAEDCSGCGYTFSHSGLMAHFSIYTSGLTKALDCMGLSP